MVSIQARQSWLQSHGKGTQNGKPELGAGQKKDCCQSSSSRSVAILAQVCGWNSSPLAGHSVAMGSACCSKRRVPELPAQPSSPTGVRTPSEDMVGPNPKAPQYDSEGHCLTPQGRNRRPRTYDLQNQEAEEAQPASYQDFLQVPESR